VEIDEIAARLLRQYWALILLCVAAPLLVIAATVAKQPPVYAASARIDSGTTVPASNAQAQAIVSQIQGIATGKTTAARALQTAGVTRNLNNFVTSEVSVSGLGGSQVVDLTVTDRNPQVAATVAKVLATEVVQSLNNVGQSGLSATLQAIDQEIVRLTEQQKVVLHQAATDPKNQDVQAKLAGLDQVIANFSGDRSRLLIQASTQGLATVLDQPVVPQHGESKALTQKLGLAGLLGLVVGILIAAIAETIRPTVPGARRVSRRLGAPTLGRLSRADMRGQLTPDFENLALRLRLAATYADVSTVTLVDVNGEHELAGLAYELERSLTPDPDGMAVPAGVADGNNHHQGSLSSGSNFGAVLVKGNKLTAENQPLHIYPIAQMKHLGGLGRVGVLVLSGPVSRVSRIVALDDLVTSSGWPIIGVVGIPRARRRLLRRPGRRDAQVSFHTRAPASPATLGHDVKDGGR
jgi:capsular polysaccharide biosynthesis protein